ncbi:MAG: amidohydrolase family protein, partial [Synergistaceae bacterium]|nr:amidohydrolase family protein [Synergistaceae bacterium]
IGGDLKHANVAMNSGMYKNAFTCGIPNSNEVGNVFAAALGYVAGNADKGLEALADVTPEDNITAKKFIDEGKVTVELSGITSRIFIQTHLETTEGTAEVTIRDSHTNITKIVVNGEVVLETEGELQNLGSDPVDYLEDTGLLDAPYLTLAHAVYLDPKADIPSANVTLVHNPCSNLKLGSGIMPLPEWIERDFPVALGTDGASSNNRLDMWEEMRTVALLHKGATRNPVCVTALDALRMATYEGAKAYGFSQKGMIREGWFADLVLVNLDKPQYIGANEENLAMYLVYAGSSADVSGTMVNGRWLYRNGEYPTLDSEEIMQKSREAREAITR